MVVRFHLWLNKGSNVSLRLEAQSSTLNRLEAVVIKELKFETLLPTLTTTLNALTLGEPIKGEEAEYAIEEDDRCGLEIINSNSRSIIMALNLNVSSKMYDITKAKNNCSTTKGLCLLRLLFPGTRYTVLTTPNKGDFDDWYLDPSFVACVFAYIAILGVCDSVIEGGAEQSAVREITEARPVPPEKQIGCTYGTADHEEDEDSGASSSSSEDLYDAELCMICYDDQRNCFFVPCGHCATCYNCAHRIVDEESNMCPICRRLVQTVRRLFNP